MGKVVAAWVLAFLGGVSTVCAIGGTAIHSLNLSHFDMPAGYVWWLVLSIVVAVVGVILFVTNSFRAVKNPSSLFDDWQ